MSGRSTRTIALSWPTAFSANLAPSRARDGNFSDQDPISPPRESIPNPFFSIQEPVGERMYTVKSLDGTLSALKIHHAAFAKWERYRHRTDLYCMSNPTA